MTCDRCTFKPCKRQCMDLPNNKTCGDCANINWCKKAYGVKPENTKCDFEPVRFKGKD